MSLKLGAAEEFLEGDLLRAGIYGRNGAGKSTLLASVPDTERLLVLVEEGQNIKPYKHIPHIKIGVVTTWDDVVEAYRNVAAARARGPSHGPTVVGFDGWPMRLIINQVTGARLAPGEEIEWLRNPPETFPTGTNKWGQWDDIAALSNWGLLAWFRLRVHLIVTFDEAEPKIDKGEVIKRGGPLLPNQPSTGIRKYLEIIGRLFAETVNESLQLDGGIPDTAIERRRLLLGENEFWFAKGPTHALGYSITNPTWAKLLLSLSAEPLHLNGHQKEEQKEEDF